LGEEQEEEVEERGVEWRREREETLLRGFNSTSSSFVCDIAGRG
jgi:hypothetical protein